MSEIKKVTAESFKAEVLESSVPVLVDFWAVWCGPCRAVAPILEEIAVEMDGRLRIVKVNVDEEPEIAARYGVSSIPTLDVFSAGKLTGSIVGAKPKGILVTEISAALG